MRVQIIGAGLGGLSTAITLAENGIPCNLISNQPSERSQSVMAAGGINAALNNMGENDTWEEHMKDTLKSGCGLADADAVRGLTENAPAIVKNLLEIGVPFNLQSGNIMQRNFGGQKKKRTAFAQSSTGKMIMTALIDECRKYEAAGLVNRYDHHEFVDLIIDENRTCKGVIVEDIHDQKKAGVGDAITQMHMYGPVVIACGGMNGLFPNQCTGSAMNTSDVVARLFNDGVKLSNLEMVQYHPTTIGIAGKRCLVSEAARGEGGRLYVERNGSPWYFMEELYPELGNLMPRDVVSREIWKVTQMEDCGNQVYLDMRNLPTETYERKLSDLRKEIKTYLGIDIKEEPVPVAPGIHYFMGGIDVDIHHKTNIENLYAVGECCNQYHGANRLGGNSMLGALYGGKVAAKVITAAWAEIDESLKVDDKAIDSTYEPSVSYRTELMIGSILTKSMGIVRDELTLHDGLAKLNELIETLEFEKDVQRANLAKALILSAIERKESRGAHCRSDYPNAEEVAHKTIAVGDGEVKVNAGE